MKLFEGEMNTITWWHGVSCPLASRCPLGRPSASIRLWGPQRQCDCSIGVWRVVGVGMTHPLATRPPSAPPSVFEVWLPVRFCSHAWA